IKYIPRIVHLSELCFLCLATPLNPGNVIINGDCRVCNVRGD
ncbi:hypothetical protein KR074_005003, partial [Drosophila pseudoananassae]